MIRCSQRLGDLTGELPPEAFTLASKAFPAPRTLSIHTPLCSVITELLPLVDCTLRTTFLITCRHIGRLSYRPDQLTRDWTALGDGQIGPQSLICCGRNK